MPYKCIEPTSGISPLNKIITYMYGCGHDSGRQNKLKNEFVKGHILGEQNIQMLENIVHLLLYTSSPQGESALGLTTL